MELSCPKLACKLRKLSSETGTPLLVDLKIVETGTDSLKLPLDFSCRDTELKPIFISFIRLFDKPLTDNIIEYHLTAGQLQL